MTNNELKQLLDEQNIDRIKTNLYDHSERIQQAINEYNPAKHTINDRLDKPIEDDNGNIVRIEMQWRLPVPYQVYINEVALVFLYGQPVQWIQQSKDTDDAFRKFKELIRTTHFNSKIRQCKRLAGAETRSAMLFRCFKDQDHKPQLQIRVLAKSKGDEIYTSFDQYEQLRLFAWGYYTKEEHNDQKYHLDIYSNDTILFCVRDGAQWIVDKQKNIIGKIPAIVFDQDKEWAGVERLIEREEYIASHNADSNDYFADPMLIINADAVASLPEKPDTAKVLVSNGSQGATSAAAYLTRDNASQAKKDELDWLQDQILSKTFTPRISLETLQSLGNLSGKALRTVMLLADIKAQKHKEIHDELLERIVSLFITTIANVIDISLKNQCDKLVIKHQFSNPFGEDTTDNINDIINCVQNGIMSKETAINKNPLIEDVLLEKELVEKEDKNKEQAWNEYNL